MDDDESVLSGFKKVKEKNSTDGFADGLSDGRDSVYQEGFDAGYEDGFKFAFLLGQYKALKNMKEPENLPPELEKTSRGECQICVNPELIKENFEDMRKVQQLKNKEREDELVKEYGAIKYEKGQDKGVTSHSKE